jgi:hypothetical protein
MSELDKRKDKGDMGLTKPRTKRVPNDTTPEDRDFDFDALPNGYDNDIWELVLGFREVALVFGFQLRTSNRMAYALLKQRLTETRLREVLEEENFSDEDIPGVSEKVFPVWSKLVRQMILLFWSDYVLRDKEAWAWEQFCTADIWHELLGLVMKSAVSANLVKSNPDKPDEPVYRAIRQPKPARPRKKDNWQVPGYKAQNPKKVNFKGKRRSTDA